MDYLLVLLYLLQTLDLQNQSRLSLKPKLTQINSSYSQNNLKYYLNRDQQNQENQKWIKTSPRLNKQVQDAEKRFFNIRLRSKSNKQFQMTKTLSASRTAVNFLKVSLNKQKQKRSNSQVSFTKTETSVIHNSKFI
ncbi:hypothetical protein pb186bvf_011429 [Paramecium bursaria]